MSILSKNTLPAEVQRGCVFAEKFQNSADVLLNELTLIGTPTFSQNEGVSLDGTTDALNANSIIKFTPIGKTTAGTFMAWIKTSDITATQEIISFGDTDADTRIQFDLYSNGLLRGIVGVAGITEWALDTDSAVFANNVWHHVALVQDGTSPILCVDGIAVAQAFSTSTDKTYWFSQMTALDNGRIGCGSWNSGGNASFFNGNIKDAKVFNIALTAQEILDYYQNSTFNYRQKAVLDLPMTLDTYDFTNKLILDKSGKGNNATLGDGSTATTFPTKLATNGFSFDGGDYIDCGDKDVYSFTDGAGTDVPFSISLWVKPNTSNVLLQKFFGANAEYIISTASDLPVMRLYTNDSNYIGRYWNKTLASFTGQWVHLVFIYDGSKTNGGIKIYFNGSRVDDNNTSAGVYAGMSNTVENLYLGYSKTNPSYYDGSLSNLLILRNVTLTPLQILDLYLAGKKQLNIV